MKILLKTMILLCCAMTLLSCDKIDDNGDFGGRWQLTEWKTLPEGTVVATKQNFIFYSVQLDLMGFSRGSGANAYLSRFSRQGDSLFIGKVYARPKDNEVPLTDLAQYGVPASGRFHIELSSHHMVLTSDEAVLKFRKY
jgi:hypothetical protein